MKNALIVLVVLLVVALLLGSSFVSRRNQMVVKREAVNAAWSQVDVVLQRRGGLFPTPGGNAKRGGGRGAKNFGGNAQGRSPPLCAAFPAWEKICPGQ